MGRPKEHNQETKAALLQAAEMLLSEGGAEAVSIRKVADSVGTTTRAVYSVFGNKQGLFGALYQTSFRTLIEHLDAVPITEDPQEDLISLGISGFRKYALARPNLYRLAFERLVPGMNPQPEDTAVALLSLERLRARLARFTAQYPCGHRTLTQLAFQYHALCQGLSALDLLGWLAPEQAAEQVWRDGLTSLIVGFKHLPVENVVERPIGVRLNALEGTKLRVFAANISDSDTFAPRYSALRGRIIREVSLIDESAPNDCNAWQMVLSEQGPMIPRCFGQFFPPIKVGSRTSGPRQAGNAPGNSDSFCFGCGIGNKSEGCNPVR
jgi:AcrR family transcriptional regulator